MTEAHCDIDQICDETQLVFEVSKTSKRLFDAAKQREIKKQREQERLKNELQGCTFAPKITQYAGKKKVNRNLDVGERLYEGYKIDREKKRALRAKRIEQEKNDITFKPKVSSSTIRKEGVNVFDRLSKSNRKQRIFELQKQQEAKELENCTFAPILSKHSARYDERNTKTEPIALIDNSRSFGSLSRSDSSVFERLERDKGLRLQRKKREQVRKMQEQLRGCTFDAKKTIESLRSEQKEKQQRIGQKKLEVDTSSVKNSGLDGSSSCFQHAINLVRFSAKTLGSPKEHKYIKSAVTDENFPVIQNVA